VDWVGRSAGVRRGSVDDGEVGVLLLGSGLFPQLGRDAVVLKSRSNSPPLRRKKKCLMELGDSCPLPRRSARLRSRIPSTGPQKSVKGGLPSASISDIDIDVCNSRLRANANPAKPAALWAIGKQIGIFCREEEEEVVKEYGSMEGRDEKVATGQKIGGRYVPL